MEQSKREALRNKAVRDEHMGKEMRQSVAEDVLDLLSSLTTEGARADKAEADNDEIRLQLGTYVNDLNASQHQNVALQGQVERLTALAESLKASLHSLRWIVICDGCEMPKEDEEILYVVEERGGNVTVVRGSRTWEEHQGFWWCDENGEFSEIGNEPGVSVVTLWSRSRILPPTAEQTAHAALTPEQEAKG